MWLRRITEIDENDLYDFMVIDAQQKNASKLSFFQFITLYAWHCMQDTLNWVCAALRQSTNVHSLCMVNSK